MNLPNAVLNFENNIAEETRQLTQRACRIRTPVLVAFSTYPTTTPQLTSY